MNRKRTAGRHRYHNRVRIPGEPRWLPPAVLGRGRLPPALATWLLDDSSLTRRLQARCQGDFRVRVRSQGWERPLEDERRSLGMRRGVLAWVRQVHLLCDGRPWVYARTVIPATTLHGEQRRLLRLGERPLGAMLFADASVRRGALEVACIPSHQPLYHAALPGKGRRPVWGRRSLFFFGARPLLVSEIFLPALLERRD
ncbi:MAG TPA: chorismate lyase [Gammaproteobacteria bacterium]|nr:chorismate lyase [Gammaproteobacteria bacterium]